MSHPPEQPEQPPATPSGRNDAHIIGGTILAIAANLVLFFGLPGQSILVLLLAPVLTLGLGGVLMGVPRTHSWGMGVLIGGSLALLVGAGTCASSLGG